MQIDSIDEIQPDVAQSESPETNPFNQALAEIESQLNGLTSAFTQLDALQTEEQECIQACEQIAAEERTVLENPNGSTKKAAVDRLVRIRAAVRAQRSWGIRDFGQWKAYAVERFKGGLDLTLKASLKTNSPVVPWALEQIKVAWNVKPD